MGEQGQRGDGPSDAEGKEPDRLSRRVQPDQVERQRQCGNQYERAASADKFAKRHGGYC
jgi:hypothetical protein